MRRPTVVQRQITLTLKLRRAEGSPDYVMVEREGRSYYLAPDVEDAPESLVHAVADAVLGELVLLREMPELDVSAKLEAT